MNDTTVASAVLSGENLVKIYRQRRVVNGVSLNVNQGEVVGLLGPNGAGKTTTFYMLTGLIAPNEGRVNYEGQDITRLAMYRRARKGIGYLPQETSIFRKLTVEDNMHLILETLGMPAAQRRENVDRLLSDFNIDHLRKSKGYVLSGGERRRVEIARSLATNPKFLLLDEPFTGIDPISVQDLQGLIIGLKNRGIGILITDHNVRETLEITDRSYIMYEGRILIQGSAKEILESEMARKHYLGDKFQVSVFADQAQNSEGEEEPAT